MKISTNYSTKYCKNIQPNRFQIQNNILSISSPIQPIDKFVKSKKCTEISFKGNIDDDIPAGFKGIYKGADWYGTKEEINALKHSIRLTPEKAYENLKNANNIMEGVTKNYKGFVEETKKVFTAFQSYKNITIEYGKVAKARLEELAKANPAWSKTPVAGVFFQMAKGKKFVEESMYSAFHVSNDYLDIIDKYFDDGIGRLHDEHVAMTQGVGLLMAPFLEDPRVNKMAQVLCTNKEKVDGYYEKLKNLTLNVIQKMAENSEKVSTGQMSKQLGRTVRKGLMFFLNYGVGDFLVDTGLDAFTDLGLDQITDEIKDITIDGISGNMAKEITKMESSHVISSSGISLVNIMHRIKR